MRVDFELDYRGFSGDFLKSIINRFLIVLNDPVFQKIIRGKFARLFSSGQAEPEKITVKSDNLKLQVLISMDIAVEEIVMNLIKALNSKKEFLLEHYLVVNVRIPAAEIRRYLKEVRKQK